VEEAMTALCPHGYELSSCLICQTLGTQPAAAGGTRPAATAPPPSGVSKARRGRRRDTVTAPPPAAVRPDVIYSARPPERRGMSLGTHVALVVAALAVIGLVAWVVAGAVFAILHILELIVIAGVAGWAGYRLGHYRGRRAGR
jgi:Flp pilus assembly protein TadB